MAAPIDWRALSDGAKMVLGTIFAVLGLVVFLILSGLGITAALREWGSFGSYQTVFLAWPVHVLHPSHAPKESQWLTITALVPAGLLLALALRASVVFGRRSLHGDARFAREGDLRANKLRGGSGIMVGWTGSVPASYGGIKKDGQPYMASIGHLNSKNLLIFPGSEHMLLTAPTRSGKGVGIVQPALLTWEGSAVTLDIKGENHRKTAGYRHECGQRVIVFDPVEPEGKTHRWNPLAYVRRGTLFQVDDLQRLAAFLYPPNDKNPFFDLSAQAAFVGVAGLIAESGVGQFTIGGIYRVMTASMDMKAHLGELLAAHEAKLSDGTKSALRDFLSSPDNTMMNIRATITSRLGLFLNPLVDAATSGNDFDFADMRRVPMSIYMTITPDNLVRLQPIINLFFQQCIDVQMRDGMPEDHKEMRHKVLFMLDEFPAIGQIQVLKKANAFVAQYGLRMVFVVQALSQLVELYGEMGCESLVKNCGMEVVFPPNHQRDAEELSDRLGFQTVKGRSETSSSGRSTSQSVSDQRRAVMLPQELLQMSPQKCLITRAGMPVILANKIRSYAEPSLVARMAIPPPPVSSIRPVGPSLAAEREAQFRRERKRHLQLQEQQSKLSPDVEALRVRLEGLQTREVGSPVEVRRADVLVSYPDTIAGLRAGTTTAEQVLREMRPARPVAPAPIEALPAPAIAPALVPNPSSAAAEASEGPAAGVPASGPALLRAAASSSAPVPEPAAASSPATVQTASPAAEPRTSDTLANALAAFIAETPGETTGPKGPRTWSVKPVLKGRRPASEAAE